VTAPLPLPGLPGLLAAQADVVARGQVVAADSARLRREVAAGRWQRYGARVVVAHNGPLTEAQQLWAAVLHHRPYAVLAGLTAARCAGLTGFEPGSVDVLVPWQSRGASLPGVSLRVTRHFDPGAVHPVAAPPRVRTATAVVQAAAWSGRPRRSAALLTAAVQQRLVRPADLRSALLRSTAVPRRALLVRTIGDLEGGAQALTEIDAVRLCRRAGLPEPTRQAVRRDRHGRRRYLDLAWEPWRLAAEIDGMQHMEALTWSDDLLRQNELVIAGTEVLRFSSLVIRTDPGRFVDQVERALVARGWRR
jgi:hypothetical protein